MELTEKEKLEFNTWLQQFIKESGHCFVTGFFIELNSGEYFGGSSLDIGDYSKWYDSKLEEYKTLKNNEHK
jgi:hypothetical protein